LWILIAAAAPLGIGRHHLNIEHGLAGEGNSWAGEANPV
jgi:hypothetical protein